MAVATSFPSSLPQGRCTSEKRGSFRQQARSLHPPHRNGSGAHQPPHRNDFSSRGKQVLRAWKDMTCAPREDRAGIPACSSSAPDTALTGVSAPAGERPCHRPCEGRCRCVLLLRRTRTSGSPSHPEGKGDVPPCTGLARRRCAYFPGPWQTWRPAWAGHGSGTWRFASGAAAESSVPRDGVISAGSAG